QYSTTRSAPWTWRRPSPRAPTTSWSAGRSARPPIRAPRRRPSRTRSLRSIQRLDEAPQVLVLRGEGTVEELDAVALDQDGREVLHLPLAHLVGVVLDIQPAKARPRELLGEREETLPVGLAAVAPERA